MTTYISPSTDSKRRRIMIITADESILDQIGKTNDASLLTQIILDAEANNNQGTSKQIKEQSSVSEKNKTIRGPLTCDICGSHAKGYNFGVISCESCKAFFRRNALKNPNEFQCRNQGQCEITHETRRGCFSCRLAKCLNSGMQRDRLLTNEQRITKHHATEQNRNLSFQSNSTTNEEHPRSLSSIYHDIEDDNIMTSIDTDVLLLDGLMDVLPSQALSPSPSLPGQQMLISPEDLQRIETISLLYQKRIELAARDGLPWDPSKQTNNYLQTLNYHSVPIMRLLSFFKQLPEFNQLNVDDKVTLIKHNIMAVLGIYCALLHDTETEQIIEADSDAPWNTQFIQLVHGYHLYQKAAKIFRTFFNVAKCDEKIILLTVIVLILTKGFSVIDDNEPMLNDHMSVFHAQSRYTDLLWKYMESILGFEKAVCLFSEFMSCIISWQTIQEQMRNDILRTLSPTDVDELLPIMKSILRISQ